MVNVNKCSCFVHYAIIGESGNIAQISLPRYYVNVIIGFIHFGACRRFWIRGALLLFNTKIRKIDRSGFNCISSVASLVFRPGYG